MDADIRLVMARGLLPLPVRGLGGVAYCDGVVRYDPAIPPDERTRLVVEALRQAVRQPDDG